MQQFSVFLADENATVAFGERLGRALRGGAVVYLEGTLGAGKTTLCRGILRAFGHSGAVKSPTYTLVEPYDLGERCLYHFDLYRLADGEELEFMGIRDYFLNNTIALIEWPARGEGYLPAADITVCLNPEKEGRKLLVATCSERGVDVLKALSE